MIIVTGGAGFIGSNLVAALNAGGETGILIVDRLAEIARPRTGIVLTPSDSASWCTAIRSPVAY